jgi:hypothetical protein
VLPRLRANNNYQSRGGILLTGLVVSFRGAAGPQGRDRGESRARQRPEARDIVKMKREKKRMERVEGKAAGDYGLYNRSEDRVGRWSACQRHTKRGER